MEGDLGNFIRQPTIVVKDLDCRAVLEGRKKLIRLKKNWLGGKGRVGRSTRLFFSRVYRFGLKNKIDYFVPILQKGRFMGPPHPILPCPRVGSNYSNIFDICNPKISRFNNLVSSQPPRSTRQSVYFYHLNTQFISAILPRGARPKPQGGHLMTTPPRRATQLFV